MQKTWFVFLVAGVSTLAVPVPVRAQSHWGVSFSATPRWQLASQLEELLEGDDAEVDLEGSELTVGVVRGSTRGGDWGVSFVHKPFKNGSRVVDMDETCFASACFPQTTTSVFQDVTLNGAEFHWFARFVNIKDRVQLGLNLAGGLASVSGQIIETTDEIEIVTVDPRTGAVTTRPRRTVETLDASEELFSLFPLAKIEAAGSIIVSRGFKARVAGGFNFPGYSARVGVVYLIGAR
jgi:hypothetical protein